MNAVEMREHIQAAPMPCEGPPPYSRPEWKAPELPGDRFSAAYGWSARSLARGLLTLCEERAELRIEDDPDVLTAALKSRWPNAFDWSGCSLNQWGWAISAVKLALQARIAPTQQKTNSKQRGSGA